MSAPAGVEVTAEYRRPRSGRLEAWAARTTDGVWLFEREETAGTPWTLVHVPTRDAYPTLPILADAGLYGTLADAAAAAGDGRALAELARRAADYADLVITVTRAAGRAAG